MTSTLRHDEAASSYELVVDGDVVSVLGYDRRGDVVVLSHTATEPEHRHRGHASALVEQVLAELSANGQRPVVRCPFVRWWVEQHGGD